MILAAALAYTSAGRARGEEGSADPWTLRRQCGSVPAHDLAPIHHHPPPPCTRRDGRRRSSRGTRIVRPAAHAGWTNLGYTGWSNGTTYFLGCKTYESGGYGPVYKTTIVGVNQTTTGKTMRMQVYRHGSQLVSSGSVWVPANSYRPLTLYTSIIFNDTVNAQLYNAAGHHASTGPRNPAGFGNC